MNEQVTGSPCSLVHASPSSRRPGQPDIQPTRLVTHAAQRTILQTECQERSDHSQQTVMPIRASLCCQTSLGIAMHRPMYVLEDPLPHLTDLYLIAVHLGNLIGLPFSWLGAEHTSRCVDVAFQFKGEGGGEATLLQTMCA
eukprot:6408679-Amphidinium_carterae.1